jgi:predicted DNA-binding helix-hairpin-helix protein
LDDVARVSTGLKRLLPFVVTPDHRPGGLTDRLDLRRHLTKPDRQLSLF